MFSAFDRHSRGSGVRQVVLNGAPEIIRNRLDAERLLPVHRSADAPAPRNVAHVAPVVWLSGMLETRNYSRQFGSHLGSVGLSLPLLANRDAANAAKPAGVTPGRYLAMTVGSRFATAL